MDKIIFDGVFEGGGVKGIALIGALKRLEEEGVVFGRKIGNVVENYLGKGVKDNMA